MPLFDAYVIVDWSAESRPKTGLPSAAMPAIRPGTLAARVAEWPRSVVWEWITWITDPLPAKLRPSTNAISQRSRSRRASRRVPVAGGSGTGGRPSPGRRP